MDVEQSIAGELEAADLAGAALEHVGEMELEPIDVGSLRRPVAEARARMLGMGMKRRRQNPREWGFLAAAVAISEKGLRDPGGQAYVVRVGLWSILRRGRGIRHETWQAIARIYNAAQRGRPEWQLRGGSSLVLGDAILDEERGEMRTMEPGASGVNMPAARLLDLGGWRPVQSPAP